MTARPARREPVSRRRRSGFTLIELLVVILIIAALIALLVPALSAVVSRARLAAVRTDMAAIDTAIAEFKSQFGDQTPSYISFVPTGADLPPATKGMLRKMFPQIQFNATLQASLTQAGLWGKELKGGEALVFFLGGVRKDPDANAATPLLATDKELAGFSKNPANPFAQPAAGQSGRVGPFHPFKVFRLTDNDNDGLLEYRDDLPGQTLPLLFVSTSRVGNYVGAHAEGVVPGWLPYKTTATTYWNPNSYQLISPGADGDYGVGGKGGAIFNPDNTAGLDVHDADNLTNFHSSRLGG